MISRSLTIVAPIVNEWAAPIPVLIMTFLFLCGLFTAYSFPEEDEFTPGQVQKEIIYDLSGKKSSQNRNAGQKDNSDSDTNVTQLNLSQALKNESSTDEVIQGGNNRNTSLTGIKNNIPQLDNRTLSGHSAD